MKGKKLLSWAMFTCICSLTGGLMVGCSSDVYAQYKFSSSQELYAFSAVSAVELAIANSQEFGLMSQNMILDDEEYENIVDRVHTFLPVFEGFTGGDMVVRCCTQISDNQDYMQMITTEYTDVIGNSRNYKIYYNEISAFDNEEGQIYNLNGEILTGENNYTFTGVREIENDETEIELIVSIDSSTSIVINQDVENDEQEFVYTLLKNGNEIYSTSIGLEVKNDKVLYTSQYESEIDGSDIELEINKSKQNIFYVEYEEDGKEIKIKVEKAVDNGIASYLYTYKDFMSIRMF